MSLHHVYCYEDHLYVPSVKLTEAGFYLEQAPVARTQRDEGQLKSALDTVIAEGNPRVATPERDEYGVPSVVRAAGARTFLVFERKATLWEVVVEETDPRLGLLSRSPKGGWGPAERNRFFTRHPHGLDELVRSIVKDAGATSK